MDANTHRMNVKGRSSRPVAAPGSCSRHVCGQKGKQRRVKRRDDAGREARHGLSRSSVYRRESSNVEFIGAANVWQGGKTGDADKADKVVIDGKTGNMAAQGSVVSQMMVQDTSPTSNTKETSRSTATAQQMHYDDTLRTVTYTTKAQLVGPQGHLTGETIVLTLGENGQDVERLEADTNVTMTEANRVTTGDHLCMSPTSRSTRSSKGKCAELSERKRAARKARTWTFNRFDDSCARGKETPVPRRKKKKRCPREA